MARIPPHDPSLEEIYQRAEELRAQRQAPTPEDRKKPVYVKTVHQPETPKRRPEYD